MFSLITHFNQPMLWEGQGNTSGSSYTKCLREELESKYSAQWLAHISRNKKPTDPNKLRNYAVFKEKFQMENYILSCNLESRRLFTKLRTSAHNLAIETGRYTRPITPRDKRLCLFCNQAATEDEYHMLMDCSLYTDERKLFHDALHIFSDIDFNIPTNTYITLMTCLEGDTEFAKEICTYVNKCFLKRNDTLEGLKK